VLQHVAMGPAGISFEDFGAVRQPHSCVEFVTQIRIHVHLLTRILHV